MPPSIEPGGLEGARLRARFALVCSGALEPSTEPEAAFEADRIDFACVLATALSERAAGLGPLPDRLGLARASLRALAARYFPAVALPDLDVERAPVAADQQALSMLIRWRGDAASEQSAWWADVIARRALCQRHLWEDLGLPGRPALTALMNRRFPRLVALNAQNMRWKKFFYRQICADSAFSLCLSPSCDECLEKADCFAPDDAPSSAAGRA